MRNRLLAALLVCLALAPPCVARSKTAAAVKAANDAKSGFHDRNAPSSFRGSTGTAVANRSVKVVIAAVLADGTLAIHTLRGEPLGSIDPIAVPEIVTRDRSRFGGRRQLEAADLQRGQRLKLTFRGRSSEILRAKVLKNPSGQS